VERHRINAGPDLAFHFDDDPDLDLDSSPSLTHVGNDEKKTL
jgi:hypothetical protein